jgi:hypothetical protein
MRKQILVLFVVAAIAVATLLIPAPGWAQGAAVGNRPAEARGAAPGGSTVLPMLARWLPAWLVGLLGAPAGSNGLAERHASTEGSGGGSGVSGSAPAPAPCVGVCGEAGIIADPDG